MEPWLLEETILPRHFNSLGLSARQLHMWCELADLTPKGHAEGRWRRFSPVQVFRLSVLAGLKSHAGIHVTRGNHVSDFVSGKKFFPEVFATWQSGAKPILVSDLLHSSCVLAFDEYKDHTKSNFGRFYCELDLEWDLAFAFCAVASGGDPGQRAEMLNAVGNRLNLGQRAGGRRRAFDFGEIQKSADVDKVMAYLDNILGMNNDR